MVLLLLLMLVLSLLLLGGHRRRFEVRARDLEEVRHALRHPLHELVRRLQAQRLVHGQVQPLAPNDAPLALLEAALLRARLALEPVEVLGHLPAQGRSLVEVLHEIQRHGDVPGEVR